MTNHNQPARVYFLPTSDNLDSERQAAALRKLYKASGAARIVAPEDFVAIKIHVGEQLNTTHVRPALIRALVTKIRGKGGQPFLTETATLYKGQRDNAVKHLRHAHQQGFSLDTVDAPLILADGLTGDAEVAVRIAGECFETVQIAREIIMADALFVVSHATGHPQFGLGGCIKNLGMGLASRKGKMRQHAAMQPRIKPRKCTFCGKCLRWCPVQAIVAQAEKAYIQPAVCIGCGQCLTVCRFGAVDCDFSTAAAQLQKYTAEYAYGAVKDKSGKCFYVNVLIDMTPGCDCYRLTQQKCMPDVGLLASDDPVALDLATLDVTRTVYGKSLAEQAFPAIDPLIQLRHAEKLGLGRLEYELVEVA